MLKSGDRVTCAGQTQSEVMVKHADLLMEALSTSNKEEEGGDFLEMQSLAGDVLLFPRLPLLLFSPLVQALLNQQHPLNQSVILLPEMSLSSLQALSQLLLTGRSRETCSIAEVRSAAEALGIHMEQLVKVEGGLVGSVNSLESREPTSNSSSLQNVEAESGAAELENDRERVDEASGSKIADFDDVLHALDKEIKRELLEEEEKSLEATSLDILSNDTSALGENCSGVKTEPPMNDSETPGGDEAEVDSEFANVLQALDQEEAKSQEQEEVWKSNLEKTDDVNLNKIQVKHDSHTLQDSAPHILSESESGGNELVAAVLEDNININTDFHHVINALDKEIGEGERNLDIQNHDSGGFDFEDVLDEPAVYQGMCYISPSSSHPEDSDRVETEQSDETFEDVFEDVVHQDGDSLEEDSKDGTEDENGSIDVEKTSDKENNKYEIMAGGTEDEKEDSGSELDQKLKKLERATRACRQTTTNKVEEEAPKKKRRTWKQEMEMLWERFEAERETEDEPEMDEKRKFMRALNLVPRTTALEIGIVLQAERDKNLENKKRDRPDDHSDETIDEKGKRTIVIEEASPSKRQRQKEKGEIVVEEAERYENQVGGQGDICLDFDIPLLQEEDVDQQATLDNNFERKETHSGKSECPADEGELVPVCDIVDDGDKEIRKGDQKSDNEDQKSDKEDQKYDNEGQKSDKGDEKEEIRKKVKVEELQLGLPDIMVIEEIDLVEFDVARYIRKA